MFIASQTGRVIVALVVASTVELTTHRAAGQVPASSARPTSTLPAYRGRLLGVYDETTGEPVADARVLDLATGASALTTKTGTVSLVYLPDGGSLIRLTKIGYESQQLLVAISVADTAPITMMMRRTTELPTVVTKATAPPQYISSRLRGFEERQRASATGYFIGDSILRRDESFRLADVVRRLPGINIDEGAVSAALLKPTTHCGSRPPQVYLDGIPLAGPAFNPKKPPTVRTSALGQPLPASQASPNDVALPFNLSDFSVSQLAGVEWYPDNAEAPIEFQHTSNRCGSLLLWTRER